MVFPLSQWLQSIVPKSLPWPLTLTFRSSLSRLVCLILGSFVRFSCGRSRIVNRLIQVSHYIFTFNCWMKNGNPPHDKHNWQVDSIDMKFGMQYNELCEVRFIEMYFKVGKLKMHVWCLKKILTQLLLNLVF